MTTRDTIATHNVARQMFPATVNSVIRCFSSLSCFCTMRSASASLAGNCLFHFDHVDRLAILATVGWINLEQVISATFFVAQCFCVGPLSKCHHVGLITTVPVQGSEHRKPQATREQRNTHVGCKACLSDPPRNDTVAAIAAPQPMVSFSKYGVLSLALSTCI
jgi:hypothetical protein